MPIQIDKIERVSAPAYFEVGSGKLSVTDPCYDPGTWCSGTMEVPNGTWGFAMAYSLCESDTLGSQRWLDERKKQLAEMSAINPLCWVLKDEIKRLEESLANYAGRVAAQIIWREDKLSPEQAAEYLRANLPRFEALDIHVGVDSGQAGFFDHDAYVAKGSYRRDEIEGRDAVYSAICKLTCDDKGMGGVIADQAGQPAWGCVSSTGYGDGGYTAYALKDELGQVMAAAIVFMEEEEEESEVEDADEPV
jgi:hypothetical protein